MTISVIIPIYNAGAFLNDCIQSVANQDYLDFECIMIDDGSTDNSGNICDVWVEQDKRFKVIHKANEGVSIARNIGIQKAKGAYITFIDSDDSVKPSYLSDLLHGITVNTELVVSGFITNNINAHTQKEYKYDEIQFDISNDNIVPFIQLNVRYLLFSPWAKLYLSDIIKKYNIHFNPNMSLGEDLHFNYEYLNHISNISCINKVNYIYNIYSDNTLSKKIRDNYFDICYNEWHTLHNFYVKHNMWNTKSKNYLYGLLWGFIYDSIFLNSHSKKDKFYLKKILSIKEIDQLRHFKNTYHCSSWIKFLILTRQAYILHLILNYK